MAPPLQLYCTQCTLSLGLITLWIQLSLTDVLGLWHLQRLAVSTANQVNITASHDGSSGLLGLLGPSVLRDFPTACCLDSAAPWNHGGRTSALYPCHFHASKSAHCQVQLPALGEPLHFIHISNFCKCGSLGAENPFLFTKKVSGWVSLFEWESGGLSIMAIISLSKRASPSTQALAPTLSFLMLFFNPKCTFCISFFFICSFSSVGLHNIHH